MLESFTFGSSPPVVRSIEMKGVNDKEAVVYLGVDVGMLFDDANIMLGR